MRERGRIVLVIGAGAAGLMAACAAADAGAQVTVLDRNEKAGKKLYITGKGRCNYTNACETADFFRSVLRNPKFLYSAVYGFDAAAMTAFLENNGCPTKVERGQRCFPASDHAYDVTDALVRHLRGKGGRIRLRCGVRSILTEPYVKKEEQGRATDPARSALAGPDSGDAQVSCRHKKEEEPAARRAVGVELEDGGRIYADAVIVAAGGASYPSTGSTGDGYRFARELGLEAVDAQPSLVPLETAEDWPKALQGLSLKNVAVKVEELPDSAALSCLREVREDQAGGAAFPESFAGRKEGPETGKEPSVSRSVRKGKRRRPVYEGFGEMLFTHFGVSGPLILSASCHTDFAVHPEGYLLHLDLKPALTAEELTGRLHREFEAAPGKELRSALRALLPQRLAETLAAVYYEQTKGDDGVPVRSLREKEIRDLAGLLKNVTLHLTGTRGFAEAIVTRGGVSVKEINPSTMETRRIPGLYWAGEVLDVDACTGGYNLQIAWSTGHLAGESAAKKERIA